MTWPTRLPHVELCFVTQKRLCLEAAFEKPIKLHLTKEQAAARMHDRLSIRDYPKYLKTRLHKQKFLLYEYYKYILLHTYSQASG